MKFNFFSIKIFLILSLPLLFVVESKVHCGEKGEFKCYDDSTCCKTPSGYRCFPVYNGSCCIDGTYACPMGEICNSKHGNKCIKTNKKE
jgi:hypothetical protein